MKYSYRQLPGDNCNFSCARKYKVPVLDPLVLKEVNFIEDEQRTVGISLTLKNTKVHGLKGTTLQKAE
jgi:hypothetical protein